MAQEKCGPTGGHPIRAPTRSDAPPSAPAAPPSALAAAERSGPAAATLRGLRLELLFDGRLQRARFRRLRTPTPGPLPRIYNYYYNYYIPDIFWYFPELVYNSIKIPVNEF